MYAIHEPLSITPKSRVELHIHLDGAIRPETIWETMRKKGLKMPGTGSLDSLKRCLQVKEPKDLMNFLKGFSIFLPAFKGDLGGIERISYEFVEDQSERGVAYCEARFCPQLFLPDFALSSQDGGKNVNVRDILEAVFRGLNKGEVEFGTKVRLVLCCIRGHKDWSWEILELCEEYRDKGVVGIDIAGNEDNTEEGKHEEDVGVFEAAKSKGIHRTIHAGEEGGWRSVQYAIDVLGAERIGHGYRTVENEEFYQKCLEDRIHFEMCPHSSYLTGAIKGLTIPSKRHPILRLAEDQGSFSINSDDPTVTGTHIGDEYNLLRSWGFTEAIFARANFEAAARSFLPADEKRELLASLREVYGIISEEKAIQVDLITPPVAKPAVKIASWEDRT